MPVTAVQAVLDTATATLATNGGESSDFLATVGGAPNEMTLCPKVVTGRAPYVRDDLAADPEYQDNPAVRAGVFRSYAGVPLILPSGHILGSFCVWGREPHDFSDDETEEMTRAADRVVQTLRHYARAS
jgi:GAF domain-containing protein